MTDRQHGCVYTLTSRVLFEERRRTIANLSSDVFSDKKKGVFFPVFYPDEMKRYFNRLSSLQ